MKYMGIGAHCDDLEIMAFDGIQKSQKDGNSFHGVVMADDNNAIRKIEQVEAAQVGKYSVSFLGLSSREVKMGHGRDSLVTALIDIKPDVVYIHNPFDKHPTHIEAMKSSISAIANFSNSVQRYPKVYGCEVWRGLDWIPDNRKVVFEVENIELQDKLLSCFKSQNELKRYDLAVSARCRANATFFESHEADTMKAAIYAVDMAPVISMNMSIYEFIDSILTEFKCDIVKNYS